MKMSKHISVIKKVKLPEDVPAELYVFPIISGYQSYDRYKKTPQENKNNTLKLDLFVLSSTTVGILGGYKAFSAALKNTKKLAKIKKDILQTVGAPFGGIITGFASGYIGNKLFPIKELTPEEVKNKEKNKHLVQKTIDNKSQKNKIKKIKQFGIFGLTLLGALMGKKASKKVLASTKFINANLTKATQKFISASGAILGAFIGLGIGDKILGSKKIVNLDNTKAQQSIDFLKDEISPSLGGFNAGRETSLKTRVKSSIFEIISAVVVPSAVMLPIVQIVRNNLEEGKAFNTLLKKLEGISKNPLTKRAICEKSITIPVTIGSYLLGNKVGEFFNQKVTQKILEKDFWDNFEKMKKEAIKSSMEGIKENDTHKTQKALNKLKEIRKLEQQANQAFSEKQKKADSQENKDETLNKTKDLLAKQFSLKHNSPQQ